MRTDMSSARESSGGEAVTRDGSVRVLVVDDSAVCRRAVAALIDSTDFFELVGEAASGREALAMLCELQPDFVLVDVRMEELDGIETARLIVRERPEAVVVLMSALPAPARLEGDSGTPFVHKSVLTVARLSELWRVHRRGRPGPGLISTPAR